MMLSDFSLTIPDLRYAFISIEGGFIASQLLKNSIVDKQILDRISAMSYSVFQTANRCSWLLKKMHAEKILIDCQNTFQFINGLGKAIFCTEIGKAKQKLGLLRLILPQFLNRMNSLIKKASEMQDHYAFDVKRLLGDLVIK